RRSYLRSATTKPIFGNLGPPVCRMGIACSVSGAGGLHYSSGRDVRCRDCNAGRRTDRSGTNGSNDRMTQSFLLQAAVFLAVSAIAAPLGRVLKAGSVIGYLAAGILIGPYGLGFVYEVYHVDSILHIAELGVVLLLFLIGLELR